MLKCILLSFSKNLAADNEGVDEMGVDQMGSRLSGSKLNEILKEV